MGVGALRDRSGVQNVNWDGKGVRGMETGSFEVEFEGLSEDGVWEHFCATDDDYLKLLLYAY